MNARPITWPTVPKGKDRVRVCLHAGNTKEHVDLLVESCMDWAVGVMRRQQEEVHESKRGPGKEQMRIEDRWTDRSSGTSKGGRGSDPESVGASGSVEVAMGAGSGRHVTLFLESKL